MTTPAGIGWTAYLLGPDVTSPAYVVELPPELSDPRPPDRLYRPVRGDQGGTVHLSTDGLFVARDGCEAYVARVLLAGRSVVYDYDHVGTARLQAGVPEDLPRSQPGPAELSDPERRDTIDRRLLKATPARPITITGADVSRELQRDLAGRTGGGTITPDPWAGADPPPPPDAPLADVLELPAGKDRRARERAVLAEEDRRVAAAIAETTPNLAHLEQERTDVAALEAERRRPVPPRPPAPGECEHLVKIAWCPTCCPSPPARLPGAELFDPEVPRG